MKTVFGKDKKQYIDLAINTCFEKMLNPSFVDEWSKWFDAMPGDSEDRAESSMPYVNPVTQEDCDRSCNETGDCSASTNVVCPQECSNLAPEYYFGDLEEVAIRQTARIMGALKKVWGVNRRANDPSTVEYPAWLGEMEACLNGELDTPGYINGLTENA